MRSVKRFIIPLVTFNLLFFSAWLGGIFSGVSPVRPPEEASPPAIRQVIVATSTPSPIVPLPTSSPTPSPTLLITRIITGVTSTPTVLPTPTVTPPSISLATPAQLLSLSPCACQATCPCSIKHVVIISIDGLRPDALEQADTPTLDALRAQGAYSPAAQAVLPSVTLINHASMLSGMSPVKHGIYWNSDDPDLGKVHGPTIFSVAHEAGLTTAMIVGKPKLEHLVLPGSVDTYVYAGFVDRQMVSAVVGLIQAGLPDLLFIHLPDVDSAGHALGWMSAGQLLALTYTDGLIGEVVAALEAQDNLDQTLLIITADHGGAGYQHGSDSPEDMTVPWLAVGPGVSAGVMLQSKIVTYDTAATALYALGLPIPEKWDGKPVLEIFETSFQPE